MTVTAGRVAMIAISGMVAQELVNGLNILPADEVLEEGKVRTAACIARHVIGCHLTQETERWKCVE